MESLYQAYEAYLPAHGWVVTNNFAQNAGSRGLYAQHASSEVSVAITPHDSGSVATATSSDVSGSVTIIDFMKNQ